MKKFLVAIVALMILSVSASASVLWNFGPYITAQVTIEAQKGIQFADGSVATTALGTTAATGTWTGTNMVLSGYGTAETLKATTFIGALTGNASTATSITATGKISTTGYITCETVRATTVIGALTGAASSNLLKAGGVVTGISSFEAKLYATSSVEGLVLRGDNNAYYKIKVISGALSVEAL